MVIATLVCFKRKQCGVEFFIWLHCHSAEALWQNEISILGDPCEKTATGGFGLVL